MTKQIMTDDEIESRVTSIVSTPYGENSLKGAQILTIRKVATNILVHQRNAYQDYISDLERRLKQAEDRADVYQDAYRRLPPNTKGLSYYLLLYLTICAAMFVAFISFVPYRTFMDWITV